MLAGVREVDEDLALIAREADLEAIAAIWPEIILRRSRSLAAAIEQRRHAIVWLVQWTSFQRSPSTTNTRRGSPLGFASLGWLHSSMRVIGYVIAVCVPVSRLRKVTIAAR